MSVSLQSTFNQVYIHLMTQKEKSLDKNDSRCLYRGENDLKCAVGCLIPDDLYDPELEGLSVCNDNVSKILSQLGHHIYLCEALQDVHDNKPVDTWEYELREVANHYDLTVPTLPATPEV